MEADWFKKRKDLKKVEKIDVLIVGINTVLRHYKLHITEAFDKNYYKFINWAAIFSKKTSYENNYKTSWKFSSRSKRI